MSSDAYQVGGKHYSTKDIQPWEVMKDWMTRDEFLAYLRGNVIKYIARYNEKAGIQDLQKAKHYLEKMIETMRELENGR